jgi:hypothetical protein
VCCRRRHVLKAAALCSAITGPRRPGTCTVWRGIRALRAARSEAGSGGAAGAATAVAAGTRRTPDARTRRLGGCGRLADPDRGVRLGRPRPLPGAGELLLGLGDLLLGALFCLWQMIEARSIPTCTRSQRGRVGSSPLSATARCFRERTAARAGVSKRQRLSGLGATAAARPKDPRRAAPPAMRASNVHGLGAADLRVGNDG